MSICRAVCRDTDPILGEDVLVHVHVVLCAGRSLAERTIMRKSDTTFESRLRFSRTVHTCKRAASDGSSDHSHEKPFSRNQLRRRRGGHTSRTTCKVPEHYVTRIHPREPPSFRRE